MGKKDRAAFLLIWKNRIAEALANIELSQVRHDITGHKFYLDEIKYWKKVHKLCINHKEKLLKA